MLTEPGLLLGSTLSHGRERQERKQKKLGAMELQQGTWSELGTQRGLLEEVAYRELEGGAKSLAGQIGQCQMLLGAVGS